MPRPMEAVAMNPNREDLFRIIPNQNRKTFVKSWGFGASNLEDRAADSNAA